MMKMLHAQFVNVHNVKSVSLHCRTSNEKAINLYLNLYKYKCIREIKEYYEDGEDAILMRVDDLQGEALESLD
jgi:ribosomal protein S18 acetylase RimI-like enzyme